MSDHYIEIITWNRKMILLHGEKLTRTQQAIGWRSNGLHVEIRYSGRYGHISWSCTLADGCGCCRFRMTNYSHPYRQSRVRIYVTTEQEARLFAKSCEMADVDIDWIATYPSSATVNGCTFGSAAIKYDKYGASFSFISKWNIWKMHETKLICNEAVANVMLEVWPDLLMVDADYQIDKAEIGSPAPEVFLHAYKQKKPHDLTPDQFEYLIRHYFYDTVGLRNPTQADIDKLIMDVNKD